MSRELPEAQRPLPVVKVLHRNTSRIQESGGRSHEVLHPVAPATLSPGQSGGEVLREAVRAKDMAAAEKTFAALAARGTGRGVQRPPLRRAGQHRGPPHRASLPRLGPALADRPGACPYACCGSRFTTASRASASGSTRPSRTSRASSCPSCSTSITWWQAAGARAGRRRLGRSPEPDDFRGHRRASRRRRGRGAGRGHGSRCDRRGHLAGRQPAYPARRRPQASEAQQNKPVGSVHGDSIGVHACDSANAWRNMAKVSNPRNTVACLILGAYQVAYDRVNRGGDFLHWSAPAAGRRSRADPGKPSPRRFWTSSTRRSGPTTKSRACAVAASTRRRSTSPPAGFRPALELRRQRGRSAARREVLSDRHRGVRRDSRRPSAGGSLSRWRA